MTNIELDRDTLTLTEGEVITLLATVTPSNATDQAVDWTSSDTGVAVVIEGGVVAIAEGEATITVTTGNGIEASCIVTVEAREVAPLEQYTVTFEVNNGIISGGATYLSLKVDEGSKLSAVTAERGQYIFKGWYKDSNRTELWDFDEDTVYDDITLYAGWEYINPYHSVIDALVGRVRDERDDEDLKVEILTVFAYNEKLCFVEKDKDGVYSYSTNVEINDEVTDLDDLIPDIVYAELTLLKDYNDVYTSDNNAVIADCMAKRYTKAANPNEAIIYSCVSEWEIDTEHIKGDTFYSCKVRAIVVDETGRVYDYGFTVVSGIADFNTVLSGWALSEEYDVEYTELGEPASDFHIERLKELDVQY